jgi:UDP-3-O-[3-hydroxymyristoyl] N-acetylglucosamine deacetylase
MGQGTLAQPLVCQGVGLHSGKITTVKICPAQINAGRYFLRVDVPDSMPIAAKVEQVRATQLSTELGQGYPVRTVEHLLAALWGLGVDNARIEIDGPEVPLLDGSAQEWVKAIQSAGVVMQGEGARPVVTLPEPISVRAGDAFVMAMPADELRFSYGIDFDLPAIGNQWHSWAVEAQSPFALEVAPARTFGLAHQIEMLRSQGLIQGGSLDNALVCGPEGWINPPLRFENEPARHKLLDLVGDLSLLGVLPQMHVIAYKASHMLHTQLAQKLADTLSLIPC